MTMTKKLFVASLALLTLLAAGTPGFSKTLRIQLQSHLIPADVERTLGPFRDAVEKLSEGQIKIKLFGGSALYP